MSAIAESSPSRTSTSDPKQPFNRARSVQKKSNNILTNVEPSFWVTVSIQFGFSLYGVLKSFEGSSEFLDTTTDES